MPLPDPIIEVLTVLHRYTCIPLQVLPVHTTIDIALPNMYTDTLYCIEM